MDYIKNTCPVCKKLFCCSAHRADHEAKNHSESHPKLKQEFLIQMFQKRTQNILLKHQNRRVSKEESVIKEMDDNTINEALSNEFISRNPRKRVYSQIEKRTLSASVAVSETRKILVPVHKHSGNHPSRVQHLIHPKYQSLILERPQKTPLHDSNVKTSTPITESLSKEQTPTGNWDHISPASSISYYGTPHLAVGQLMLRPQQKTSITPLRSIMAKSSKYTQDSDGDTPSHIFNSSKGRRVTFSFSSSRISSTNSSPLESVQEIEIQEEKREVITSVSSVKSSSEEQVCPGFEGDTNYVLEVTSTINSCVQTSEMCNKSVTNTQRFDEDSLASVKGGLFSCVASMFCSAVPKFPLWRGLDTRSKRSRSPERGIENAVVQSPLPKRPCYPSDLRLNPIRARKPISQTFS